MKEDEGEDIHPSSYYQTPTTLTAKDYISILESIKQQGDLPVLVEGTLALFKNIEDGHKHAFDFLNNLDISNSNRSFRGWLAYRVIIQAINYFSRLWRTDKDLIEYFEDYKLYLEYEQKCLQHPYTYLKAIEKHK